MDRNEANNLSSQRDAKSETPKIEDQPIGNTTRRVVVGAYFRHQLSKQMAEMFQILAPNDYNEYTRQKYSDQVCSLASLLAQEYQAVTGYPVLEMMVQKGIVRKPDPSHPGVPDVIVPPPAPPVVGTDVAREELGALRLDDDEG